MLHVMDLSGRFFFPEAVPNSVRKPRTSKSLLFAATQILPLIQLSYLIAKILKRALPAIRNNPL